MYRAVWPIVELDESVPAHAAPAAARHRCSKAGRGCKNIEQRRAVRAAGRAVAYLVSSQITCALARMRAA
jgi:hypothetical protein